MHSLIEVVAITHPYGFVDGGLLGHAAVLEKRLQSPENGFQSHFGPRRTKLGACMDAVKA